MHSRLGNDVRLVPLELVGGERLYLFILHLQRSTINNQLFLRLITEIVGKDKLQVVVAGFREIDDATMLIGLENG